jgi:hypothetical protein
VVANSRSGLGYFFATVGASLGLGWWSQEFELEADRDWKDFLKASTTSNLQRRYQQDNTKLLAQAHS